MRGVVLSPKTFKLSDVVAAEVLMCLVHPHCGSLLPSIVFNVLVTVTTQCAPAGAHTNHHSEARECCSSSSKYSLHRNATPFGWCLQALFRFESCESLCVEAVMCQCFSAHHICSGSSSILRLPISSRCSKSSQYQRSRVFLKMPVHWQLKAWTCQSFKSGNHFKKWQYHCSPGHRLGNLVSHFRQITIY